MLEMKNNSNKSMRNVRKKCVQVKSEYLYIKKIIFKPAVSCRINDSVLSMFQSHIFLYTFLTFPHKLGNASFLCILSFENQFNNSCSLIGTEA